ncbi:MAG: Gfo/Idh/MocA family oxidoreductase [Propionibacteriaceae bacterium]|nr:Gfo/Idh/MocA family oxidoreductase [Propionibacteriaceae bacterium]
MLRFGIVGTNFISEWFAAACRATNGRAAAVAVCSRDAARARRFADRIGAAGGHDDLGRMAAEVDAVYVASPIASHHAQAIQAISAGRHVLVEKTMGATADEVADILAAADRAGVIAMEAVRNVHTPTHDLVRDAMAHIGVPRHARFEKLQYSSRYDAFRAGERPNAFDPGLGNSSLADIGVYCLQPAVDLFGAPARTTGASIWLENGFEGGGSLTLDYGSLVADIVYSKIAPGTGPSVITGEDGSIILDDPGEPSQVTLHRRGDDPQVLLDLPAVQPGDTMAHEVDDFIDQVEAGAADPRWSRLSLTCRRLMDEQLARRRDVS